MFQVGEIVFVKNQGKFAVIIDAQEQIMSIEQSSLESYAVEDIVSLNDPRFTAASSFAKNGLLNHNVGHLATAFCILRDLNKQF